MAITYGRLGDFSDTTSKIKNSFLIKEHALKAQKLNPKDSTVVHVLGRWCFGVANISFVERTAASVIFATPPTSTFEEALDFFLQYDKLVEGKGMIRNKLFIGDSYLKLGKKDEAAEWFKKAMECESHSPSDTKFIEEAQKKHKEATASGWW
jgi:hypothetical protein